jgi:hypothetical protein
MSATVGEGEEVEELDDNSDREEEYDSVSKSDDNDCASTTALLPDDSDTDCSMTDTCSI